MTDVNPLQTSDPLGALLALGMAGGRFPPNSRYAVIDTTTLTTADGTTVVYLRRRFCPPPERLMVIEEHRVAQGERLDTIAADSLGDPELFWRICDANRAMRPHDLTDELGRRLAIALPDSDAGVAGV
ncbi:MAG TPA: LysM domain-containing protein [Actinomycetota bacterium]|nr:LysM domain-containing protein [Actinomycetota bacterium]